jgi:transposase-like protein
VVYNGVTGIARVSGPSRSRRSVIEVVARGEPRRRWSQEDGAHHLAEAMAPSANASRVARRFGISTVQFST